GHSFSFGSSKHVALVSVSKCHLLVPSQLTSRFWRGSVASQCSSKPWETSLFAPPSLTCPPPVMRWFSGLGVRVRVAGITVRVGVSVRVLAGVLVGVLVACRGGVGVLVRVLVV